MGSFLAKSVLCNFPLFTALGLRGEPGLLLHKHFRDVEAAFRACSRHWNGLPQIRAPLVPYEEIPTVVQVVSARIFFLADVTR